MLARLVAVMATENKVGRAAGLDQFAGGCSCYCHGVPQDLVGGLLHALVIQKPFTHLSIKLDLVLLIERPTHVKNVRKLGPSHDFLHEILAPMKGVSAWKVVFIPREDFDGQAVHASVLLQERHEGNLVAARR